MKLKSYPTNLLTNPLHQIKIDMENNNDNKAKFFAQYWGQKVVVRDVKHDDILFNVWANTIIEVISDQRIKSYLELNCLSNITDEHALSISKTCYRGLEAHTVEAGKNIALGLVKEYSILHVGEVLIFVTDFLRAKGYALPWMELSVEQLVSLGWVKLKEG